MRKTLRPIAALVVTISLFGASVLAAPNDAEDVRSTVMGFSTAWNHHDMVAFGKLFAVDADFVNVGGVWWQGRQQIQLNHAYSHGTIPENSIPEGNPSHYAIFKHSTMTFVHIKVRFLRKDVAVAHVNWKLLGDTRTSNSRHGVLTFVLTRQKGGWLIAVAQNTEINREVQ
jgi:uncharacterized protein (TIGR02246 family)